MKESEIRSSSARPATRKKTERSRPARADYHHGDLRNAMLREGRKFLEEAGVGELSLREIARRAGVSEAAPSWHFGGKEGLLAEIASEGFEELHTIRKAISCGNLSDVDKVRAMMASYIDFTSKNRGLFNLMVGPRILDFTVFPTLREVSLRSFDLFSDTVEALAARWGWPDEELPFAAHAAWALEHGMATLILANRLPRPGVDLDRLVHTAIDLMVRSIVSGPISASERPAAQFTTGSTARKKSAVTKRGG